MTVFKDPGRNDGNRKAWCQELYSIIASKDQNVDIQNIHRSLNIETWDSCDFYQLSHGLGLFKPVNTTIGTVKVNWHQNGLRIFPSRKKEKLSLLALQTTALITVQLLLQLEARLFLVRVPCSQSKGLSQSTTLERSSDKFRECWDSNPGPLG